MHFFVLVLFNKIFVESKFGLLLRPFLVAFALKPHPLRVCLADISNTRRDWKIQTPAEMFSLYHWPLARKKCFLASLTMCFLIVFSREGPDRLRLFLDAYVCLNDWSSLPSRDSGGATRRIFPPGIRPVCAASLALLHRRRSGCICLSWAFFPFTHSLRRVARQISIIHKQLSYLPQRTTQVFCLPIQN